MPPEKGPDAFRTISEAAEILDLPQHVLRFWETKFAQIKPVKRGGGRRFYRPDDIDLLAGIKTLLYVEGMTIRGVQKVLRDRGARSVVELGRGSEPELRDRVIAADAVRDAQASLPFRDDAVAMDAAADDIDDLLQDLDEDPGWSAASPVAWLRRKTGTGAQTGAERSQSDATVPRRAVQEVLFELLECARMLDEVR